MDSIPLIFWGQCEPPSLGFVLVRVSSAVMNSMTKRSLERKGFVFFLKLMRAYIIGEVGGRSTKKEP